VARPAAAVADVDVRVAEILREHYAGEAKDDG
jgi:hypothetical protein